MEQQEKIQELLGFSYQIAEKVHRNLSLFYVERAGCKYYDSDFEISRDHTYPYYTIHFLFDGCGFFRIRGQDHFLTKGEAFLIMPGEEHIYCNFTASSLGMMWVESSGLLCGEVLLELKKRGIYVFQREHTGRAMESLGSLLQYLKDQEEINDFQVSAKLYTFFMDVLEGTVGQTKPEQPPMFLKALEYIHQRFDKNIRVSEVAEHLHVSTAYLNRIFHQNAGISPIKYITWKRMEYACSLLFKEGMTCDRISEQMGFYDSAYFVKVFKSVMGMTPLQYKKKNVRKDNQENKKMLK